MTWRGAVSPLERLYACLPYILPMAGGSIFGSFLYIQFPPIRDIFLPFIYLRSFIGRGILPGPLGDLSLEFFIWFGIFIFVVRNPRLKHFIRFNAMQALMIDISMSLISGILELFNLTVLPTAKTLIFDFARLSNGNEGGFLSLLFGTLFSTIFLAVTAMCLYAVFQSARGKYAEVPIVSDAAYNITR
jgi:uncharacterized membrane protein